MNNECKRLLNQLSFSEYKTFIRNALGLLFFNTQEYINNHIVLSSKNRREVNKNNNKEGRFRDAVAYAYIEGKNVNNSEYEFVFYVDKNDYKKRVLDKTNLKRQSIRIFLTEN